MHHSISRGATSQWLSTGKRLNKPAVFRALEAGGSSLGNIIKVTIFVTDMASNFDEVTFGLATPEMPTTGCMALATHAREVDPACMPMRR